jgi:hypothetical protein
MNWAGFLADFEDQTTMFRRHSGMVRRTRPGIHNHESGLWIPGSHFVAPRNDDGVHAGRAKSPRQGGRQCDPSKKHTFAISRRDAPEFCRKPLALSKERAQGRPGARCTRGLVCNVQKMRTRAYRSSGSIPAFPAQWLYGLFRALPGVPGFLASVTFTDTSAKA